MNKISDIDSETILYLLDEINSLKDKKVTSLAPDVPVFIRNNRIPNPFKDIAVKALKQQGYKNPAISISLTKATKEGIIGWWLDEAYYPIIDS